MAITRPSSFKNKQSIHRNNSFHRPIAVGSKIDFPNAAARLYKTRTKQVRIVQSNNPFIIPQLHISTCLELADSDSDSLII